MSTGARSLGLVAGYALDLAFGDPRRGHPVAIFGSLAQRCEARVYADSRAAGALHTSLLVGGVVLLAESARASLGSGSNRREVLLVAASTWAVLGGTSLVREGDAMAARLDAGDLPGARDRLSHLCARDPSSLDLPELARATVESVAENTSDAVVAPLFWGAALGVPGLLGYRAVNTLDAMVGYRSARYQNFGWASARLDDLLNLVPARLTALLTALVSGRPGPALRAWTRDAGRHPSPNAGVVEAAYAGALGVRLSGSNVYGGQEEDRGVMGDGHAVEVGDVRRANRLSRQVSTAALVVCALLALVPRARR